MASSKIIKVLFGITGFLAALLCLFFLFYTLRLIYVNLTVPDIAARRSFGMYVGFVAFPLAALIFGWIGWRCLKALRN